MKVTFLGTGTSQGVPVIGCSCEVCRSLDYRDKRLRTSVHLDIDGHSLVIDTGPDFREQMLRERITSLEAVLYTHAHRDHTAGLDDIRAYNFLQGVNIPLYATRQVLRQIRTDFNYIFNEKIYPGIPQVELVEITDHPFSINGISVSPLPVLHLKLPVTGFRIGNFSYITDANFIPPDTMQKLGGSEVLVLNALQIEPHISHFTLSEAIEIAANIKPKQTYLVHISHKLGLHAKIEKELPDGVALAFDGLQINI